MDRSQEQDYIPRAESVSHISATAYTALIFLFMSFAIITATARTVMRLKKFSRIDYDDVLLILSTLFMIAATAIVFKMRDSAYYQLASSLGFMQVPPPDFIPNMVEYAILSNVASITTWGALFSVKFAFVVFFRKLVSRVKNLQRWWWCVFVFCGIAMPINMFGGFMICWDFSDTMLQTCTVGGMTYRESIYQYLGAMLDIVSDILVISIPIALLWKVKINLRRKLALGTVCCLSVVMVILAIVRVADSHVASPLSPEIPPAADSPWLYTLQVVESGVAIIMVSITAFRSMLGQSTSSAYEKYDRRGSNHKTTVLAGRKEPKEWAALDSHDDSGENYAMSPSASKPLPHVPNGTLNGIRIQESYETHSETAPNSAKSFEGRNMSWA